MDILLHQFNRGDERAFKKLFDSFFGASCAFVKHYIPEHEAVEDVVQETLIRVWKKRDEWTQFGSIEAYCLTVAKNLAIDRSERKDARAVELTPDMEEASEASGPYERLVNKERMALIHRLINELPEKQRLIMQLRDMEGKSYKEIAVVLSLTEEQVKVNLFRARQKVKQRFIDIEGYGL